MAETNPPLQYKENELDVINGAKDEAGNELRSILTNLEVINKLILNGWRIRIVGVEGN
jgi:hypothetical protein